MRKRVLVSAPALSQSGYGVHARTVLRSLRTREDLFDVYLENLNWGATSWLWQDDEERRWIDSLLLKTFQYSQAGGHYDISLQVTIPNEWKNKAEINIGCTAGIETTKITGEWAQASYLMDKIIVVSNFSREAFVNTYFDIVDQATGESKRAQAKGPVEVVNYPFVPAEETELELDLQSDFNFLLVSQWSPRKNFENTIKWFVEEFYDQNVGLVVKASTANNCYSDFLFTKNRILSLLSNPVYKDRKCNVHLLHGSMDRQEFAGLYTHPKIKALINIAHGEGFGLPMIEAAGHGLPIITIGWGGQVDFLYVPEKRKGQKKKRLVAKFAEVNYSMGKVLPEAVWDGVLRADSDWAYADQGNFKMTLRDVKKKYSVYQRRAKDLQKHVLENFTEEKKYAEFCSHLEEYIESDESWLQEIQEIVHSYE